MRVSHAHTVIYDPERMARVAAHQARIEAEMPKADRIALARRVKKPKPRKKPWWQKWVRKIDRINAMASNVGWSLS